MQNFEGKVAVITGAGRGIGRAIAFRCAQEGMKVVLAGIGMESLSKTDADLKAMGAETLVVQTDVSLQDDVENLAEKSFDTFGAVHSLCNNAGVIARGTTVLHSTIDDWNWVMDVNFYGVLYGIRAFVPRMIDQGTDGHVVNVSSLAGSTPGYIMPAIYAVSKHAVVTLSESLYGELAKTASQIKVTVYAPGQVNTEVYAQERSRPERFNSSTVIKPQTPEEMAELQERRNKNGMPPEQAANVLFSAIEADKLYVGVEAYEPIHPFVPDLLRERAENMINEQNPQT